MCFANASNYQRNGYFCVQTPMRILKSSLGRDLKWLLNNAFISQGTPFYFRTAATWTYHTSPSFTILLLLDMSPRQIVWDRPFLSKILPFLAAFWHILYSLPAFTGSQLNYSQLPIFCCYIPHPAITQLCNSILCNTIFSLVKKNGMKKCINRLSFKSLHNSLV